MDFLVRTFLAGTLWATGLVGLTVLAQSNDPATALAALSVVPADKAAQLARIVGREGKPTPDRWHFLIHDPTAPAGLREYVVAQGVLAAARSLSQFAERIEPADVVGAAAVRVDSDQAARVARDYAVANGAALASMNYELLREGAEAAPVWRVTCFDEAGALLGEVVLTAADGTLISHTGFPLAPAPVAQTQRLETYADQRVAPEPGLARTEDQAEPSPTPRRKTAAVAKKRASQSKKEKEESKVGRSFRKVGGKLQKFFTGRDTISR